MERLPSACLRGHPVDAPVDGAHAARDRALQGLSVGIRFLVAM